MADAVATVVEGRPVAVIQGAELVATLVAGAEAARDTAVSSATTAVQARTTTEQIRDAFAITAATAQAGLLTTSALYPTTAAGLTATAEGGYFLVASGGDAYASLYRKVSGAASLINVLASQAALDRVARFVPAVASVDNVPAINAALALSTVAGVILPPGNIQCDSRINIPSGKFLRGSGRGATRLVRAAYGGSQDGFIKATGTTGVQISDLTLQCPLNNHSFNGVWMQNSTDFAVERVAVENAAYSFWAEGGSRGVFRDLVSLNANVHFETTDAQDILFDDMLALDGAGNNPAGCEAVWHCLGTSRNITFRNGRHSGKGQAFLLVANAASGGLMSGIVFDNCRSVMSEDKISSYILQQTGTMGRAEILDCDITNITGTTGVLWQFMNGDVLVRGGRYYSKSAQNFITTANANVVFRDVDVLIESASGASGAAFGGDANVKVFDANVKTTSTTVTLAVGALHVSQGTVFDGPTKIFAPPKGWTLRYIYTADVALASGSDLIGVGSGQPTLSFVGIAGARYRVMLRGQIRRTGAAGLVQVYLSPSSGISIPTVYGHTRIQKTDNTWQDNRPDYGVAGFVLNPVPQNAVRAFEVDITVQQVGENAISLTMGDGGVTMLAGAELTIERLS